MNAIKILGTVAGVGEQILTLTGQSGASKTVTAEAAAGALLVAASPEDAQRVSAVVGGLAPSGDRQAALAALYPHLPAKALGAILGLADGMTEALSDDGTLDAQEAFSIGIRALQEAL